MYEIIFERIIGINRQCVLQKFDARHLFIRSRRPMEVVKNYKHLFIALVFLLSM